MSESFSNAVSSSKFQYGSIPVLLHSRYELRFLVIDFVFPVINIRYLLYSNLCDHGRLICWSKRNENRGLSEYSVEVRANIEPLIRRGVHIGNGDFVIFCKKALD